MEKFIRILGNIAWIGPTITFIVGLFFLLVYPEKLTREFSVIGVMIVGVVICISLFCLLIIILFKDEEINNKQNK